MLNQLYTLSFGECIIGLIGGQKMKTKFTVMSNNKTTWFASVPREELELWMTVWNSCSSSTEFTTWANYDVKGVYSVG